MKKKLFLFSALFWAFTTLKADNSQQEIVLYELPSIIIIGDSPLDNPSLGDVTPVNPNQFHATICDNVLSVNIDISSQAELIIRKRSNNSIVLDRSFTDYSSEIISEDGDYSIEIYAVNTGVIGFFEVH